MCLESIKILNPKTVMTFALASGMLATAVNAPAEGLNIELTPFGAYRAALLGGDYRWYAYRGPIHGPRASRGLENREVWRCVNFARLFTVLFTHRSLAW